eukprot:TRINITY_DN13938_c0_g1_i1.p1 TRINITY_DN13938_c0_g1~~TRINITY_DN13938_c0_g1_i1.p1  ORF type:complete len:241 (+),score=23.99 TRINITY_DN13938_c0_g1_i1:87-809(+)
MSSSAKRPVSCDASYSGSKRARSGALEQNSLPGLRDYFGPNMRVIFVGDNPGLKSGTEGHHYAHTGNHFYKLLIESGIVDSKITHKDDSTLPTRFGIGLTNIVNRVTRSTSDLSSNEMIQGAAQLLEKLKPHITDKVIICFNGMGVFEACLKSVSAAKVEGTNKKPKEQVQLGLQPAGVLPGINCDVFVVPSSSPRAFAYTKADKLVLYKQLKALLDAKSLSPEVNVKLAREEYEKEFGI